MSQSFTFIDVAGCGNQAQYNVSEKDSNSGLSWWQRATSPQALGSSPELRGGCRPRIPPLKELNVGRDGESIRRAYPHQNSFSR